MDPKVLRRVAQLIDSKCECGGAGVRCDRCHDLALLLDTNQQPLAKSLRDQASSEEQRETKACLV